MCRLLGLIANKPVDFEFSLLEFKNFGDTNPDGWGIGWYKDGNAEIFKEGISAKDSKQFLSLSKEVKSSIIVAHVRKKTNGEPSYENSHPFKYKNWLFAHNGSVDRISLLAKLNEAYQHELKGETDSEVYFYWILQCIEKYKNIITGIRKATEYITTFEHKGLNFLLTNGQCLYAFRYSNILRENYSLYKLKRDVSQSGAFEFKSKKTGALLQSKSLIGEKAILLCSEQLTDEKWEEIETGNMLIVNSKLNTKLVQIL